MVLWKERLFCALFKKKKNALHDTEKNKQTKIYHQDINKSADKASFSLCPMTPEKFASF